MEHKYTIKTLEDIDTLSAEILSLDPTIKIFLFKGDLGAGKTTLTKSMVRFLGLMEEVSSPTFSIVNVYDGPIYHFDLYRIKSIEELEDIGFFEYLYSGDYCFIEWPEIAEDYIDTPHMQINISINENKTRNVLILKS